MPALAPGGPWLDALFCLGLSLLLAHELDAMRAREWRILPVLHRLPERWGRDGFVLLHVPLFALILWLASHPDPEVRTAFQVTADLFFVVHVALHRALSGHPDYEFHGRVPSALILGTGAAGALHLVLLLSR